jgi:hypothetical protein
MRYIGRVNGKGRQRSTPQRDRAVRGRAVDRADIVMDGRRHGHAAQGSHLHGIARSWEVAEGAPSATCPRTARPLSCTPPPSYPNYTAALGHEASIYGKEVELTGRSCAGERDDEGVRLARVS